MGSCAGLQNPILGGSNPDQGSLQSKRKNRSSRFSESRNRKHVTIKGSFRKCNMFQRVFKQPVSGRKIRFRKEATDKLEKSKSFYTIPAFQNGRPLPNAYFTISINQKCRKYFKFKWEENTVQVSLPLLQTRPRQRA